MKRLALAWLIWFIALSGLAVLVHLIDVNLTSSPSLSVSKTAQKTYLTRPH